MITESLNSEIPIVFNLQRKQNFVEKIGGKNLTEANPRELTTICSKNQECRKN